MLVEENSLFKKFMGISILAMLLTVPFFNINYLSNTEDNNIKNIDTKNPHNSLTNAESLTNAKNDLEYSYVKDNENYQYSTKSMNYTPNLTYEIYNSDNDHFYIVSPNVVTEVYDGGGDVGSHVPVDSSDINVGVYDDDDGGDVGSHVPVDSSDMHSNGNLKSMNVDIKSYNSDDEDNNVIPFSDVSSENYDSDDDFIIIKEEDVGVHLPDNPLPLPDDYFVTNNLKLGFDSDNNNIALNSDINYNDYNPLKFRGNSKVFDGNGRTITIIELSTMFYVGENQVLTIKNCRFIGNYTSAGSLLYNDRGIVFFENCSFENFSSNGYGSVVYNNGGTVSFKNCTLLNNSAHGGGVIYNNAGILYIENCVFNGNKADIGGCIYTDDGMTGIIGSIFDGNSANVSGATVASKNSVLFIGEIPNTYLKMFSWVSSNEDIGEKFKINTRDTFFRSNGNGGVVSVDGDKYGVSLKNSTFTNNKSVCFISNGSNYTLNFYNLVFKSNKGALSINGSNVQAFIYNSSFIKNFGNYGAAVFLNLVDSLVVFSFCDFIKNFASNFGGAIYANGSNYRINILNCNFINNYAFKGSSIFADGFSYFFNVKDSSFRDNIDTFSNHSWTGIFAVLNKGVFLLDGNDIVNTVLNGAYVEWVAGALSTSMQIFLCVLFGLVILVLIVIITLLVIVTLASLGILSEVTIPLISACVTAIASLLAISVAGASMICFTVIAVILIGLAFAAKAFYESANFILAKFLAYSVLVASVVLMIAICIVTFAGLLNVMAELLALKIKFGEVLQLFLCIIGMLLNCITVGFSVYNLANAFINPDILFDTAIAFAVMTFLVAVLEVISALSVGLPLKFDLFSSIQGRLENYSTELVKSVLFSVQLGIIAASVLVFMGLEEFLSFIAPEFEEWSSKYSWFVIMAFVMAGMSSMFTESALIPQQPGIYHMTNYSICRDMMLESVIEVLDARAVAGTGFIAKFLGLFAGFCKYVFQLFHLDDIALGIIISVRSNK
ncbi:MAG: right-handed parallel beta-helix repeat-containing protein [Methanobrevibacter sp.]|jgi:hypothetical protein|nr:right-handed parallel beta-helix repeat-containing protein [Candidatus Methanovirga australis]